MNFCKDCKWFVPVILKCAHKSAIVETLDLVTGAVDRYQLSASGNREMLETRNDVTETSKHCGQIGNYFERKS